MSEQASGPTQADMDQWAINNERAKARRGLVIPSVESMSLRDYFAGQVIDGASRDLIEPKDIANRAYAVADAMLRERAK